MLPLYGFILLFYPHICISNNADNTIIVKYAKGSLPLDPTTAPHIPNNDLDIDWRSFIQFRYISLTLKSPSPTMYTI